jgi:hypothetical protein
MQMGNPLSTIGPYNDQVDSFFFTRDASGVSKPTQLFIDVKLSSCHSAPFSFYTVIHT